MSTSVNVFIVLDVCVARVYVCVCGVCGCVNVCARVYVCAYVRVRMKSRHIKGRSLVYPSLR